MTLEDQGYEVLVAKDGEDAVAVHKAHGAEIDLLVSDVVMPRMGGVDLAKALDAAQPGLKVVFMSGYTAETSNQVSEFATKGNFLQKPFHSEELISLVDKIVPVAPEDDDAAEPERNFGQSAA